MSEYSADEHNANEHNADEQRQPHTAQTEQDAQHTQPVADREVGVEARLGPDASPREIARAARSAFFGRDLVQSGPSPWPFGRRAQARQARNRQVAEEARRRRTQFRDAFTTPSPPGSARPNRWRPVPRRTHVAVIAALVGLVAAVIAAGLWLSQPDPDPQTSTSDTPPPPSTSRAQATATASSAGPVSSVAGGISAQPPIPSGGVAPITARPATPVDPATVVVVDPPAGDPTPAELADPEQAMRAWLIRLCPFRYLDPFGAAERRSRPAMTDAGWASFDPNNDPRVRASWDKTVAARESGRCAAPEAHISPEAPRTASSAIVIGSATRVITSDGQRPYLEQLVELRIVRRGADGLWRVDLPTEGG